jgi:hypothetical protein
MEKNIVVGFYKQNKNELKKIFDLQNVLVRAKNMIIKKLQTIKDNISQYMKTDEGGFRVTTPEGFVAVDRLGTKALKLIDRLEFSRENFTAKKDWSK